MPQGLSTLKIPFPERLLRKTFMTCPKSIVSIKLKFFAIIVYRALQPRIFKKTKKRKKKKTTKPEELAYDCETLTQTVSSSLS